LVPLAHQPADCSRVGRGINDSLAGAAAILGAIMDGVSMQDEFEQPSVWS